MKTAQELYREKCMSAEQVLDQIHSRDMLVCAQSAAEPQALLEKMHYLKTTGVKDVVLYTCVPAQDYAFFHDPEMQGIIDHRSWFFNAGIRRAHKEGLASMAPQRSQCCLPKALDRAAFEGRRPVLLATVSPMDKHGYLSLSLSAIYEMDLIRSGAVVLVEVNPNYPRTFGDTMIHISQVTALVESDRPVPEATIEPYTEKDATIGRYIADLVEDGSTIQLGIGYIPNAVAHELRHKKHLGIQTEMFTETMVDLIECGAVDNSQKGYYDGYSLCSFTLGSKRLYDFLDDNPSVLFKSCLLTNNPSEIAKVNKFVSINATLEVDLTGQCASEAIGPMQYSGTGGQSDTVIGSQLSPGGKSILAMHSTYSTRDADGNEVLHSKIVPTLAPGSVVSTSRNDTDYVVTEYGVAWLRGLDIRGRVKELIRIAHPDFREWLRAEAERLELW